MPRHYRRKICSRNYKTTNTDKTVARALRDITSGSMSIRKASEHYRVPFGTLQNRSKGIHSKKAGGQRGLTDRCKKQIVVTIDVLTEWKVHPCAN